MCQSDRKKYAQKLFQKRQISIVEEHNTSSLKRTLGLLDVLVYGIGASVGAGIYSLVGVGATITGPSVTLSFFVCGIACMFTALSFAEFAAKTPIAGSVYSYAYASFGELPAWIIGWNLCLEYAITAAVVARSWAEYVSSFLSSITTGRSHNVLTKHFWKSLVKLPIPFTSHTCSPLSIIIVILSTCILLCGVQESTRFNNIMTMFNIAVLAAAVLIPISTDSAHVENLTPYMPEGITGVTSGAAILFFSYIGFDMVACLSEEVINPKINMPLGIIGSLFCSMVIYVAVAFSVVSMAPVAFLGPDVPISNGMLANACCSMEEMTQYLSTPEVCLNADCYPLNHPLLLYSSRFISGGAIFGLTTATFTSMMGQPRIAYRIAKDGLLPPIFAKVDSETQVPKFGIIFNGWTVGILACFFNLDALANTISLLVLMIFTFVNAAVIILRVRPTKPIIDIVGNGNLDSLSIDCEKSEISPLKSPSNISITTYAPPCTTDYSMHIHTCILAISITITSLLQTSSKSTIFAYPFVFLSILSLIVIFYKMKSSQLQNTNNNKREETFQCPCVPLIPLLGIMCNSWMMGSLPMYSWIFVIVFLVLGLVFYFVYGIDHSDLNNCDGNVECTRKSSEDTAEVSPVPSYSSIEQK